MDAGRLAKSWERLSEVAAFILAIIRARCARGVRPFRRLGACIFDLDEVALTGLPPTLLEARFR